MGRNKKLEVSASKYEPFWIGTTPVSRCLRCGTICFRDADEVAHGKARCRKAELIPLTKAEKTGPARGMILSVTKEV